MKLQLPSPGFAYLTATIACFVGFFGYVLRPMWWESGSDQEYFKGEAAYLERLANAATSDAHGDWLTDAVQLYFDADDLDGAARILATAKNNDITIRPDVLVEVQPYLCWLIHGNKGVGVYLRNDTDQERRVRLHWTAMADGHGILRTAGGGLSTFDIQKDQATVIERTIPAGKSQLLHVQATLAEDGEYHDLALELARVERAS